MKITWYGTASIVVSTPKGDLLFDPYLKYLPKNYEQPHLLPQRKRAFEAQSRVFITHGHLDHLAHVSKLFGDKPCQIYLTKTPYKKLQKQGMDASQLHQIAPGDKIQLDGVTVSVYPGKHVQFKKEDMWRDTFCKRHLLHPLRKLKLSIDYLRYPEKGQIVMYQVECQGKRVQILGSAGLCDNVNYPTGADALVLPHQGRSDIDQLNALLVQKLAPKRVLLDHFDDAFPPYSQTVDVQTFCSTMNQTIPTQPLEEGISVEI